MNKIFITGATGFIGGRLAEVLCARNKSVVAIVRTWSRAARLARLPVSMLPGDVLDIHSLKAAMQGCDTVFHCAVDNKASGEAHRRVSVEGTENVMQAALEAEVKRVVHLSSTAVYGYRPKPDTVTEDGDYCQTKDDYCAGKIDGEKVALRFYKEFALPVTVLRPTIVYGPFGDYSKDIVALIRQSRMLLVNGGKGICNCLYVDNLVDAMLLAAEKDSAVGQVFHISDADPVTWKDFIEAHALALGEKFLPIPEMAEQEIASSRWQIKKERPSSWQQMWKLILDPRTRRALNSIPVIARTLGAGRSVARLLLPLSIREQISGKLFNDKNRVAMEGNIPQTASADILSQPEVFMVTAFENVSFCIEKARQVLGYDPQISFTEGTKYTSEWIKWANI